MDLTARNTNQLLLVNIDGAINVSTKAAGEMIRTYTDLNDGQIAFTDPKGLTHTAAGGTPWLTGCLFKIVVRNGTNLYWTPVLSGARSTVYPYVSYVRGKYYTAPVPQIDYIGYNTATGSIEVINSNYYKIWIHAKEADAMGQGSAIVKDGAYDSTASDTQANIAYELTLSLINNFKREPIKDIYFDRTYSGAQTLLNPGAGNWANWTVVKGSQYATSIGGAHGLVAGNYLNLAGLLFIVTEATSPTVVKLDIAWQHESGTCIAGDVTVTPTAATTGGNATTTNVVLSANHLITAGTIVFIGLANNLATAATAVFYSGIAGGTSAASDITLDTPFRGTVDAANVISGGSVALAGNWGIRLQGAPRTSSFVVGKVAYSQPSWSMFIEDFGATAITNAVAAVLGTGTGYQVAELEHFCQGFEKGNFTDLKDHLNTSRAHAVVTNNYDYITLSVKDEKAVSAITGQPTSFSEIVIAANNATASQTIKAIQNILDDVLGTIAIDA